MDLDLGFGFGFDVLIDRRSQLVGFVNRRWFGLLLSEAVALLQGGEFEAVDAVEHAVEFLFETVVSGVFGLEIESAAEKQVEGGVEILLGGFEVPGVVVVLSGLVFLFDAGDQVGDGIGLEDCGFGWGSAAGVAGFCCGGAGGLLALALLALVMAGALA